MQGGNDIKNRPPPPLRVSLKTKWPAAAVAAGASYYLDDGASAQLSIRLGFFHSVNKARTTEERVWLRETRPSCPTCSHHAFLDDTARTRGGHQQASLSFLFAVFVCPMVDVLPCFSCFLLSACLFDFERGRKILSKILASFVVMMC